MIEHACKALARWRGPRVVVDRDALTWLIRRAGDAAIYRKEPERIAACEPAHRKRIHAFIDKEEPS